MFWYYIKTAASTLLNNKKFSIINIAGFAFGISVCFAIALFVMREYSFDRYHENSAEIFRLLDIKNNTSQIDYRAEEILLSKVPEVINACYVQRMSRPVEVRYGDKGFYIDDILSADKKFFKVFTVPFHSGNSNDPFVDLNSAVVSRSTATMIFGNEDPVGKELLLFDGQRITVTGVIEDFPENSSLTGSIIVNGENERFKFFVSMEDSRDRSTYRWLFMIYLQLEPGTKTASLETKINKDSNLLFPYVGKAGLLPLKDMYLHDPTTGNETRQGNPGLISLMLAIGLIILMLAVINYINLTVAQKNKRNKETGLRKTIGASGTEIMFHQMSESLLVTLSATVLAMILLWLLLPVYRIIFNANINPSALFRFPAVLILTASVILTGLLSGSIPALIMSAVNPVKILSSSIVNNVRKKLLYNSLTVFQFVISITLIFCVIVVERQIGFVKHMNPGFKKEQLVRMDLPDWEGGTLKNAATLIGEFRKSPFIKAVTGSTSVPGDIRMNLGSNMEDSKKNISVPSIIADTSFLRTFGIKVIKGRDLEPGDYGKVCMFNEAAYKHFEFTDLENKRFNNFGGYDIIGVVNDFQYTSLHKTIGPACIIFTQNTSISTISVRFSPNGVSGGLETIKKLWTKYMPGKPLRFRFYDDWFNSMYQNEERFAKSIGFFAILAIVISCIGILGLATFSAERRTKEIGVRKTNGAMVREIMLMLNKDYITWIILALILSAPASFYSMGKWLSGFAYRTQLSWWYFVISGGIALVMAIITVSWQSWKAATRNPVEALRYE